MNEQNIIFLNILKNLFLRSAINFSGSSLISVGFK